MLNKGENSIRKSKRYVLIEKCKVFCGIQYADDITVFKQCSFKDLAQNVADFDNSLSYMASWSLKSNLALNPVKTMSMLLSTSQMGSFHKLKGKNLNLSSSSVYSHLFKKST